MPKGYKYPDLSQRKSKSDFLDGPKGGKRELSPVQSTLLLMFGVFVVLAILYYTRDVCQDCYKTSKEESISVCQEDGESTADFHIRVNQYRKRGYKCE